MIAALLLVARIAAVQAVATPAPLPPQDWSTLPTLRFERPVAERPALADFVRSEIRNGRCAAQRQTDIGWAVTVDVAVLVTPQGAVRRTVPRAIGCPSVEQYAAGLAFSRATGNTVTDGMTSDGWFRISMAFSWPG